MSLSRRRFTRLACLSTASISTPSIFFLRVAEAAEADFQLNTLSTKRVFSDLVSVAAGSVVGDVSAPPTDKQTARVILSADSEFVRRQFINDKTKLAQAGKSAGKNYLWGQKKQERLGPNVGFGFVQKFQDDLSSAAITGPTMTALHVASRYLQDRRVAPDDIAGSLIPVRSQFDDWGTWEGDDDPVRGKTGVGFTSFRTVLGEVTSRYDLKRDGAGGFGDVEITIEAGGYPRREILVRVRF
jgi:hypothetical protein